MQEKCSRCKKLFVPEEKKNGDKYKTCKVCREREKLQRERNKCEHNKQRSKCIICKGSGICEHNKTRYQCIICKGSGICEHNKRRSDCIICKGTEICEHNKRRSTCIICTPKRACQNCKSVYVDPRSKFIPFCFSCYCVLNPDIDIPRQYKLKEHHLRDFLKEEFKDIEMIFDKTCGESKRRPDVLINCDTYNIVIECDENQHKSKDYNCECKRTMEIFADLRNKSLVMIRFNPDSFINYKGERIKGCFEMTKKSGWKINSKEWIRRIETLKGIIRETIKNPPEKEITYSEWFYDEE